MKLGVLTNLFSDQSLEVTLDYLKSLGVQAVEIGCGGYPGKAHANAGELIADEKKLNAFLKTIKKYGMTISAVSAHGNPVHPNKEIARQYDADFRDAILFAEKIGVDTIVGFSGCPGDCGNSSFPNWVTCPWPTDFGKILDYQWNQVLIPYWKQMTAFARQHHVTKIAFEMHPGFCVYNPETLLRLRDAVGEEIGANFDPSHLFWQGIDPVMAIRELGRHHAIYHFHAKDTKIDSSNTAINGVLDNKSYTDIAGRSWNFRTVGYGHDYAVWSDICSELRKVGYDHVMSIEHEDGLMTPKEGLEKAVAFLKQVMIFESKSVDMWWS